MRLARPGFCDYIELKQGIGDRYDRVSESFRLLLDEPLYSRLIIFSTRYLRFFYGRARFLCAAPKIFECRSGRITGPAPARGDTMALSVLAERLIPRSYPKCHTPEFRMEWKFASTSDVRDPRHSESRLAQFKNSHEVDFLGPVHCVISECKRTEVTSVE
jgi:hypothetical protein